MSVEPDPTEMHAGGLEHRGSVRGSGQNLPFADDCIDVTVSSNVVEHTPTPWEMADDMLRVTRPGGVVIISYTLWWGPFGGHEMGLTHYLGGHRAARLYTRRHGHPPKNLFGTSLFAVHAADVEDDAAVEVGYERLHHLRGVGRQGAVEPGGVGLLVAEVVQQPGRAPQGGQSGHTVAAGSRGRHRRDTLIDRSLGSSPATRR
jgi:SAM-dependent methyltransferase